MGSQSRDVEARDVSLLPSSKASEPERETEEQGQEQQLQEVEDTEPKATARAITINFITGGLGSAIFSLPWSLAGTSIIPGMVIVALVLLVNGWTISILVRAAERYKAFDLGSVISHLPGGLGPPLQVITNIFVWISMFLCLVSYIIVIHDSGAHFLKHTFLNSRLMLVSLASLLVLPLCFLSQKWLEKTSSIAVLINIYLFVLVGVFYGQKAGNDDLPDNCCALGWTIRGNFAMVTVMFQAVIIQMCVLPMYRELENRTPEKFDRIVAVGFSALFVIFSGFSTLAYLLIGPNVSNDVLKPASEGGLPDSRWTDAAKLGVIFVVACVYPIMVYPMIAPLQSSEFLRGPRRKIAITSAKVLIVLAALVVSWLVDSLGVVNVVNGAMSCGIFVALVPSVVGLRLLEAGAGYRVALVLLLVFGLAVSGAGFVFSDNYTGDLKCAIPI